MEEQGLRNLRIRDLDCRDYAPNWRAMRDFTDTRDATTEDELWLVEHSPVFTLGQAGDPRHILDAGDIPVVKTDRGGQVTYHGPGQFVAYPLVDIKRLGLGARAFVSGLENAVIAFLSEFAIEASTRANAPGVYVEDKKIASLGLRIRRGASYHGVAINIAMDLRPFARINPCGYPGLAMVNLCDLLSSSEWLDMAEIKRKFSRQLARQFGMQCRFPAVSPETCE